MQQRTQLNTDLSDFVDKEKLFANMATDQNLVEPSEHETVIDDIENQINYEKQITVTKAKHLDLDINQLMPDKKQKTWDLSYLKEEIKIQTANMNFSEKVVADAQIKSELKKFKYGSENTILVGDSAFLKPETLEERNKNILRLKPEKDSDVLIKSYI